jgi:hypothetical protein
MISLLNGSCLTSNLVLEKQRLNENQSLLSFPQFTTSTLLAPTVYSINILQGAHEPVSRRRDLSYSFLLFAPLISFYFYLQPEPCGVLR